MHRHTAGGSAVRVPQGLCSDRACHTAHAANTHVAYLKRFNLMLRHHFIIIKPDPCPA
jgi:hypothetical protein